MVQKCETRSVILFNTRFIIDSIVILVCFCFKLKYYSFAFKRDLTRSSIILAKSDIFFIYIFINQSIKVLLKMFAILLHFVLLFLKLNIVLHWNIFFWDLINFRMNTRCNNNFFLNSTLLIYNQHFLTRNFII